MLRTTQWTAIPTPLPAMQIGKASRMQQLVTWNPKRIGTIVGSQLLSAKIRRWTREIPRYLADSQKRTQVTADDSVAVGPSQRRQRLMNRFACRKTAKAGATGPHTALVERRRSFRQSTRKLRRQRTRKRNGCPPGQWNRAKISFVRRWLTTPTTVRVRNSETSLARQQGWLEETVLILPVL